METTYLKEQALSRVPPPGWDHEDTLHSWGHVQGWCMLVVRLSWKVAASSDIQTPLLWDGLAFQSFLVCLKTRLSHMNRTTAVISVRWGEIRICHLSLPIRTGCLKLCLLWNGQWVLGLSEVDRLTCHPYFKLWLPVPAVLGFELIISSWVFFP